MPQNRQRQYIGGGATGIIIGAGNPTSRALKATGEQIFQVGKDYIQKMAREDAEADLAQEKNRSALSWANAEEQMKGISNPKEMVSFYEEWENEERKHVAGIDSNRLGKRAIGMQSEAALTKSRIKTQGPGGYVDAAYINKNIAVWEEQKQNAYKGIVPDGFDSAEDAFNFAVDKQAGLDPRRQAMAVKEKSKFVVTSNYHTIDGELTAWQQAYNNGEFSSPAIAMEALDQIQGKADGLELETGQRATINKTLGYRTASLMKGERNIREKIITDAANAQVEGRLDIEDLDPFYRNYPGEYAKIVSRFKEGLQLRETGAEDPEHRASAKKTAEIILNHTSGKTSTFETLRAIEEKIENPSDMRTALVLVGYNDYTNTSGLSDYDLYDKWGWGNKKISADPNSFMAQVAKKSALYMLRGSGSSAWFSEVNNAALKWDLKNPGATQKEREEQLTSLFKDQSTREIRESYRQSAQRKINKVMTDDDVINEFLQGAE